MNFSLVTTTASRDRCREFINKVREARFIKIKNRQVNKFNRLVSKSGNDRNNGGRERNTQSNRQMQAASYNSNNNSINNNNQSQPSNPNKWVINLSNTPLTPAQESLLAKGPNFAVAS